MADFTLSNIALSQSVIADGDNITLSFTIKNTDTSGRAITSIRIYLQSPNSIVIANVTRSGLNIAKNKSENISIPIAVNADYPDSSGVTANEYFGSNRTVRSAAVKMQVQVSDSSFTTIKNFNSVATMLNKRYNPTVSVFSMTRTPDDEGTNLLLTAKLAASDNTASLLQAKLYYKKGGEPGFGVGEATGSIPLTSSISNLISGVANNSSLVTGTFANSSEWCFMLWFGDSYESDRKYFSVNDASANVHLSGKANGGVRFGGFSTSTDDSPKFECDYPTYLYGNIVQIGGDADSSEVWEELALASSSITTPGTYGDILKIRKIENKCIIKGSVMIKPGSSTTTIAVLPEAYKPLRCTYRLNGCQGARIARVAVHGTEGTNYGELVLEWIYNIGGENAGSQFTSNSIWVDCAIEYWID